MKVADKSIFFIETGLCFGMNNAGIFAKNVPYSKKLLRMDASTNETAKINKSSQNKCLKLEPPPYYRMTAQ